MVIDEIINYLKAKIEEEELSVGVLEAYTYGHKVKSTEIQVQIAEHTEYSRFTTFDDIEVSVCPLIINIYANQEKRIIDETEVIIPAQRASYELAHKVMGWLKPLNVQEIPSVIGSTSPRYLPGVPFDTGTLLYQSVVRTDLYVKKL